MSPYHNVSGASGTNSRPTRSGSSLGTAAAIVVRLHGRGCTLTRPISRMSRCTRFFQESIIHLQLSIILTKLRQLCPFGQRQRLVLHATLLFRPIYPVLQRVLMNAKTLRNLRDRTTGINNQGNRLGLILRSELPPTRHPSSSYIPVNLKSTVNGSGTTSL